MADEEFSSEEKRRYKQLVFKLEEELKTKNLEVMTYRSELQKFSKKLDDLIAKMSHDTRLLVQMQRVLIPTELPRISGFEISRKFVYGTQSGGDYFDIFEHNDKFRFGVLLASSSGYAMSALFLSLILKSFPVLSAKRANPPEKVLQEFADELKGLAGPKDSTSCFYAVIDRRDYSFKFCSVGAIHGFYLSKAKVAQHLSSELGPIGNSFSGVLQSAQIKLEPLSRLCIVSEGLLDILQPERIVKAMTDSSRLGVHELRNEILFQAQRISGLDEPVRDQTVIVLEAKDQVIKLATSSD